MKTAIIIPARYGSTRIPGKVLSDINGKTMTQHVYERAIESKAGNVYLAIDDEQVADSARLYGAHTIMTPKHLLSGTDRVYNALQSIDPDASKYDIIINVQGDIPNVHPSLIKNCFDTLNSNPECDIATPVVKMTNLDDINEPSVVKVAMTKPQNDVSRALYFSRSPIPFEAETYYEHVGIYAFRRSSLEKFVHLSQSPLEQCEKLEQLRALEEGMTILCCVCSQKPVSVDIQSDLTLARKLMK